MRHALAVALFASVVLASPAAADSAPSKDALRDHAELRSDIRRLLVLTGAGELGEQMMANMIAQFRTTMPSVPSAFWDEFQGEVDADEIVELVVPIYARHFTHEDVQALIAFYESPIGRKFVEAQPQILQESMAVGERWGQQLAQRVMERLASRGYR